MGDNSCTSVSSSVKWGSIQQPRKLRVRAWEVRCPNWVPCSSSPPSPGNSHLPRGHHLSFLNPKVLIPRGLLGRPWPRDVTLICLILWLRLTTTSPMGSRDHVCLDMGFLVRSTSPKQLFNKLEEKERGHKRPLEQRWKEQNPRLKQGHTEKRRQGSTVMGEGSQGQESQGWGEERPREKR